MKIGIISDSHDSHTGVLKAVNLFNQYNVEYILHAGDIVSPFTAKAFADVKNAKFIAVYGNNEGEKEYLKETIESFNGEIYDNVYEGKIANRKIFMKHIINEPGKIAKERNPDLIIYGHTHKQDIRKINGTLIINPGESTDWLTGKSNIVILQLEDMTYQVISLL